MNKLYKCIFNHATQSWVAVSETTHAKGKKSSGALVVSSLLTITSLAGFSGGASAAGVSATAAMGNALVCGAPGDQAVASGTNPFALGCRATATGDYTMAIGVDSKATATQALAVGNLSSATAQRATAVGTGASASGTGSVSVGNATAVSVNGVAIGTGSFTGSALSNVGGTITPSNAGQVAIGDSAKTATYAQIAIGLNANTNSTGANYSIAIGGDTNSLGNSSIAMGRKANATTTNAIAIGPYANASKINSVALGNAATTDTNATTVASAALNGLTYGSFAGQVTATGMQVSVGKAGAERQIKNVGSGEISATSTDGINGSQLYATNSVLGNLANTTQNILGGNAALAPNGSLTMTNIGGTGKNTIHDAILASQEEVVAGTNVASVVKTTDATTGVDTFTVNANGTTASAGSTAVTVTPTLGANNITNYAVDLSQTTKDTLNSGINITADNGTADNVKLGETVTYTSTDGNVVTTVSDNQIDFGLGSKLTVGSANPIVIDGDAGTVGGLTNTTWDPAAITSGQAASEDQLLQATSDLVDTGINITADNGTADNVKLGETVTYTSTDGNVVTTVTDNQIDFGLGSKLTVGSTNPIVIDGDAGTVGGLTNTTWDPAAITSGQAASEDQLLSVANEVTDLGNTPITFAGDTGTNVDRKLGETVKVVGGQTDAAQLTDGNIGVVADGTDTLSIKLAKDIDLGTDGSVLIGNTLLNNNGLVITGGPSVTSSGIDAGSLKIINLAVGDVSSTSMDGINGSQLYALGTGVQNIIGGSTTYNPTTGTYVNNDIGGTGKGNINDAISSVNQAATKAKTTVTQGENVVVSQTTNTDGSTNYEVATAKDVTFDSVKVGSVNINKNNVDAAGNTIISGVGKGEVSSTSNDAVNGSQLYDLGTGVKDIIGGNTTYDPNTGKYVNNDIGGTGKGNINDAIASVNQTATKAKTTVTQGENVVVTQTTNTDGSTNYQVATAKDVNFDSVKVGSVNINKNNVDAAGNTIISGVGKGEVSSTSIDAVNGSQLYATNQNVTKNTTDITNINTTLDKGLNFSADSGTTVNRKLGDTVAITGDGNITTTTTANGVQVKLSDSIDVKNVNVSQNFSVAEGATVNMGGNVIENVAAGVKDTDAVNVGQLKNVANHISNVEDKLSGGIAASAALAVVTPIEPGTYHLSGGTAYYNGGYGVGFNLLKRSDNGRTTMHAGVAWGSGGGGALVRVGAGFSFGGN